MAHSKTPSKQTSLRCSDCGNLAVIWRIEGKQKKAGHLKHMYCYKCQRITEHIEKEKWEWKEYM